VNTNFTDVTTCDSTLAPIASPALTGAPTAPTQSAGDNSTKIATTAFVDQTVRPTIGQNSTNGFASSGMPSATTLAVSGGLRYVYSFSFSGTYSNSNGTPLTPVVQITIRNNNSSGTILYQANFSTAVPSGYGYPLNLAFGVLKLDAPASGTYWIQATDAESDGGSHTWLYTLLTSSAAVDSD
jgi:hypothetical protein